MDGPSPGSFTMHGARAAIAGGLVHIEQQVTSIEQAVVENPALAFDLAKTLVESVCKAVLEERFIEFAVDDDLPKLFKRTTQILPFLPADVSHEAAARKSLAQTLGGLSTAVRGICELRNHCGFASHGSAGPRPVMEAVQALMAAEAADTIVGFLHRVHRQDRAPSPPAPTLYDDNPRFNESVDETHEMVRIFNEEFLPSRVLFELALEPHRLYLTEFNSEGQSGEGESSENGVVGPAL